MKPASLYTSIFNRLSKSVISSTTTKVNTSDKLAMERIRAGVRRRVLAYNKTLHIDEIPYPTKVIVRKHSTRVNTAIISLVPAD